MRKLLFINGHLNVGGVERSLVDLLRHLDYSRYEVELMLLEGAGDYLKELPEEVNVYTYDFRNSDGPFLKTMIRELVHLRWRGVGFRLAKLAKWNFLFKLVLAPCRKKYDVAVSYRTGICNYLAIDVCNAKKGISWWHHGGMTLNANDKQTLRNEYGKADVIVAVSKFCENLLQNEFPEIKDKVITISNILSVDEIIRKSNVRNYNIGDNFNIVSVGRLYADKNPMLCVKTANLLKKKGVDFHWYIVGDGGEYERLKEQIQTMNLEESVILTGALDNPYYIMKNANVLFHPSPIESQGLTILEAMTLGVPVVCVHSAGPHEFIADGKNGIFINNDDRNGADVLKELYENPDKLKSMAQYGLQTIGQFTSDEIMPLINNIFSV